VHHIDHHTRATALPARSCTSNTQHIRSLAPPSSENRLWYFAPLRPARCQCRIPPRSPLRRPDPPPSAPQRPPHANALIQKSPAPRCFPQMRCARARRRRSDPVPGNMPVGAPLSKRAPPARIRSVGQIPRANLSSCGFCWAAFPHAQRKFRGQCPPPSPPPSLFVTATCIGVVAIALGHVGSCAKSA
jgi:hypothetical protein